MAQLAIGLAITGATTLASKLLFPTKTTSSTNDMTQYVSSSVWGTPIPILYGTGRLAGNIIWMGPVKEEQSSETISGGKGGGGGSQTIVGNSSNGGVTYSCSFAMAFCEGPIQQVIRIWANGQIVYDATSVDDIAVQNIAFHFHGGDESQGPEGYIQDWVSKNVPDASGAVPTFRGICYILFPDFPMGDFGNAIPTISAELSTVPPNINDSLTQWANIYPANDQGPPNTTAEGGGSDASGSDGSDGSDGSGDGGGESGGGAGTG
jgi:hypothetical protein